MAWRIVGCSPRGWPAVVDVDEDEQALAAYNAWLHGVAQRRPEY